MNIHVVFVGVPASLVDLQLVRSQLPAWYSPINRAQRALVPVTTRFVDYSLIYDFTFAPDGVANAYASWVVASERMSPAPYWVQEAPQPTDRIGLIDSGSAEEWFRGHFAQPLASGYTLFLVDTWDTNPSVKDVYFYNMGYVAADSGVDASRRYSRYGIGYGGHYRFLFLDLSAGPTDAGDVNAYDIPPIWTYNKDTDAEKFSTATALYIQATVASRFLASWLYEPRFSPNYYLELVVLSNDSSFDYGAYIQRTTILQTFRALQPRASWNLDVSSHYLWDYPELYGVLRGALNTTYGYVQYFPKVHDYLLGHYTQFVTPHPNGTVIPVLIFAFPSYLTFDFTSLADSDPQGNPKFVAMGVNRFLLGIDPFNYPPFTRTFYPGYYATDSYVYGDLGYGGREVVSGTVTVDSGETDLYVLDEVNFNLWRGGQAFTASLSRTALGGRTYGLTFDAPAPGYYFFVLFNRYTYSASVTLSLTDSFTLGVSLAWVVTHEAGHMLGLPHPHDFYLPPYGETGSFLWDYSATPMGYLNERPSFGQLDSDILLRGDALTTLHDAAQALSALRETMVHGHVRLVPTNVLSAIQRTESGMMAALGAFNDTSSLDNYGTALDSALESASLARSANATLAHDMALAPVLAVAAPAAGGSAVRSDTVFVNGTVDDIYGLDGNATVDGSPLAFLWADARHFTVVATGLGEGSHTISLRLTDAHGNVLTHEVKETIDNTPPSLTINSPSEGALVTGTGVNISWTAEDLTSGVARTEVSIDGEPARDAGLGSSLALTDLTDGHHVALVRVYDVAGNSREKILTFTIKAPGGTPNANPSYPSAQYAFLATMPRTVLYLSNLVLFAALLGLVLQYRRRAKLRRPPG